MTANFEHALEKVGGWGRYQKIIVSLICLIFVPMGFFIFSPVFTYLTPPHRCYIPELDGVVTNAANVSYNDTVLEAYIPSLLSDSGDMELARCERYVRKRIPSNVSTNLDDSNNGHKSTTLTYYDGSQTTPAELKTESCLDGWVYMDPEGRSSAVTEFNLVCADSWKKPVLTAGLIFGLFLGGFILGPVTDRLGRRKVCLINATLHIVLIIALGFIPTYELLVLMVVVIGASHIIWYGCTFVLAQELVDRKHRAVVACMINVIYAVGYMILPAVAFFLKDWRWMIRALGFGSLIFVPYFFFLPESPRWLASRGRYGEAYKILKTMARINKSGKDVLDDLKTNNLNLEDNLLKKKVKPNTERRKSSVQILAKNPVMRKRSLLLCWVWNVSFLCYYVLGLNTSNLGGSNYWNCFVAAALEIPSHFLVVFTIQKAGRRSSLTAFIGLSGLFIALCPAFGNYDAVTIIFAMLGKFFATSTMGILYLYTSELYPTLLRSTGIGMASTSSRLGSICAPFLVFVGENSGKYIPFYVMATLGLATAGLCLLLPETRQSPLPDTMQDAVNLEKFRLSLSCKRSNTGDSTEADVVGSNGGRSEDEFADLVA